LYVLGLKLHMRNAVRLGATAAEILEVLEIVSVIGIHAAPVGAPILAEELRNRAARDRDGDSPASLDGGQALDVV
jgi:alkylhydroperoxidase/carboxymuconolactone decarboxylase family protein YurZ